MAQGMRDVELDEDGSSPTAGSDPEMQAPTPRRAGRRRRTLLALAGVAVAVAAALVIGQAVVDGRRAADDAALAERYADVPGVVLPVDETLHALWSVDG